MNPPGRASAVERGPLLLRRAASSDARVSKSALTPGMRSSSVWPARLIIPHWDGMARPNDRAIVRELVGALRGVLARAAEPNHVLSVILRHAVVLSGATRGVFVEVSSGGGLAYRVLHRYRADLLQDPGHFSRAVFAAALANGEDLLLDNAATDPRFEA